MTDEDQFVLVIEWLSKFTLENEWTYCIWSVKIDFIKAFCRVVIASVAENAYKNI